MLGENSNCIVCSSNKSRFLKKEHQDNRKNTETIDPKMARTKNGRLLMQSKCTGNGMKKSRFVKEQEAKGLLSNLGIKTPLSKIPLLNVLF